MLFCGTTDAQDVIGLSLPLSGRLSPVAERIEFGAQAAANTLKAQGHNVRLALVDDGCDQRKVSDATKALASEQVKIVVGPTCFAIARQIAEALNDKNGPTVPVIALNTRNPLLARYRDNEGLPLFEIANAPDAEARAVVREILPRFSGKPFAIIDDGSVYGRGLADQVRLLAEDSGLRPVENANFRPLQTNQLSLLRRLRRSGVEALFLAASPEDIVTITKDLESLQYDWPVGVGETARLLPFTLSAELVPDGLMMVRVKDLPTQQAVDLMQQLKNDKVEVEDALLLGHTLVEIAAQILKEPGKRLEDTTFETVIGPLTFGSNGRATPVPFSLYRWQSGAFQAAEAP